MPIRVGNTIIAEGASNITVGSTPVQQVYAGSDLVWERQGTRSGTVTFTVASNFICNKLYLHLHRKTRLICVKNQTLIIL